MYTGRQGRLDEGSLLSSAALLPHSPRCSRTKAVKGPDGMARQIRSVQPALIPVVYYRTKCSVWQ